MNENLNSFFEFIIVILFLLFVFAIIIICKALYFGGIAFIVGKVLGLI